MSENNDIKYVEQLTKYPSYIKALTNEDEDIILVHSLLKDNKVLDESILSMSPYSGISEGETELDITGSPLKYSFDNSNVMCTSIRDNQQNNWLKEEEKHYPLNIEDARAYITDYCLKNNNKGSNQNDMAVWCVCDGRDKQNTVLISAKQTANSITRTVVTTEGYLPRSIRMARAEYYSTMSNMLSKHLQLAPNVERQVKTKVSTVYKIKGSKITNELKDDRSEVIGSVFLEIAWEKGFFKIPNDDCETSMILQVSVGHPKCVSAAFWDDLLLIELYINTLTEYSSQTMRHSDWLPKKNLTASDLNLVDLAIEVVYKAQNKPKYEQKNHAIDLKNIVENVKTRSTLDATDQLWPILIQCTTYGILVNCLNAFISEIAYNDSNLFISDSNETSMAHMIRGIIAGKMAVPTFTGTQPIEILIEIGIEKLRKDYVHVYTQGRISEEKELNDLFRYKSEKSAEITEKPVLNDVKGKRKTMVILPNMPVINRLNIEQEIKVLGQLETLLEMLLLVTPNLLHYTARTAFNHFLGSQSPITSLTTLAKNKLHELRVKLPTNEVRQHIEGMDPVKWSCTLTTDQYPWYQAQSVFHHSQQQIFPPAFYNCDLPREAVDETKAFYHCTIFSQIKTLLAGKI